MKKGIGIRISLACLLGLILLGATSCVYVSGCDGWNQSAKYERQVELSAPLAPGSAFAAETRDGSITLEGVESAECQLVATVRAWAKTEELAQELVVNRSKCHSPRQPVGSKWSSIHRRSFATPITAFR